MKIDTVKSVDLRIMLTACMHDDAILYHRNTIKMENKQCKGMGIYFPDDRDKYLHNDWIHGYLYETMAFANEGWLDFLNAYWDAK